METIRLDIVDHELSKLVFKVVRVSPCVLDPWRLYSAPRLLERVSKTILELWENQKMDIVASVSDLGMPLVVNVALEAYNRGLFRGRLYFLTPLSSNRWIYPSVEVNGLKDKKIFLCDEIINLGTHALFAIEKLKREGAHIFKFIVLVDNWTEPNRKAINKIKAHGLNPLAISGVYSRGEL